MYRKQIDAWTEIEREADDVSELAKIAVETDDESLREEVEDHFTKLKARFQEMEFEALLSGPYDDRNALVAFHAGTGGVEAMDWAEMLMRMILRYAEKKGFRAVMLDESRGEEAGIKSAIFSIEGPYAYGFLKSEHGVHRLVRQSPFNADNLRQTSFALIEVLPEINEIGEIEIKAEDLRVDTFRASGAGGQHVNKTSSAVRITHIPSGIVVSCQTERSQAQNRESCMKLLRAKLHKKAEEEKARERAQVRGEYQSAEWGNQIRSYVLHPYKLVKDHRTEVETSQALDVLDGDLTAFIEGYLRQYCALPMDKPSSVAPTESA